jgi:hypothetical protein
MKRLGSALVCLYLSLAGIWLPAQQGDAQAPPTGVTDAITIPADSKIELVVIRPVWAKTAAAGASVYAQTIYPVVVGTRLAIPPGTYVQGTIEKVTRPTRKVNQAEFQILFTKIIFANGYTLALADPAGAAVSQPVAAETLMQVDVQVSTANDLLLDNGTQMEILLGAPLTVDANAVSASVVLSRAPQPGNLKSATLCRPTEGTPGSPGTPGTPDIVIPGSPGTPDTVIPGGPGMPDTVIPGIPATPSTVIPGSPGTPGDPGTAPTYCPNPPLTISSKLVPLPSMPGQNNVPPATH